MIGNQIKMIAAGIVAAGLLVFGLGAVAQGRGEGGEPKEDSSPHSPAGDRAEDVRRPGGIQGTWRMSHFTRGIRSEELRDGVRVVISDRALATPAASVGYSVDPDPDPMHIDLKPDVSDSDQDLLGIYRVEDDRLTICFAKERFGRRPVDFEPRPGNQVWELRRISTPAPTDQRGRGIARAANHTSRSDRGP